MRALHIHAAGDEPQLAELPDAEAADGTVLIEIKAVSINGFDLAIANGMMAQMMPMEYPIVLGRDAAGVVAAVGAGVEGVSVGDRVAAHMLPVPPLREGTLADLAALPAASVVVLPEELDFVQAGAIPLAGSAAVGVINALDPRPGETVLVNGASGGVGSFIVQLLAAKGVTVVATAAGDDARRLLDLGADQVVDFAAGPVADQVLATYPDGVDALANLTAFAPDQVPVAAVRTGGRLASLTVLPDADALTARDVTGTMVYATPVADVVGPLVAQVAAGELRVDIGTVLPLDRAVEGLALMGAGQSRGKIVVTLDG